jgi:hypothetical protein
LLTRASAGPESAFFSLDELADVTRTATKRNVTVLQDLTPDVVFLQVRRLEAELTWKRKADAAFIGKPRR